MKTQIEAKIEELTAQAKALQSQIDHFELDPDDYTEQYEEMLDEVNGEFMGMNASYILKKMDPTAYRCGLLDYLDSLDQEDEKMKNDDCVELIEELEEIESEIEELDDKLTEMGGLDQE